MSKYALGLDFGTESVRALMVNCETGEESAQSVVQYPHGVIAEILPDSDIQLPPDFALQHPGDYVTCVTTAIRDVLKIIPAGDIVGIGVDFTACTILPVLRDGTPLMELDRFKVNPHAWVKLWKHHAAQPEADRINTLARERGEAFLKYYGGAISSEWMLPKCWEIARRAPEVYRAADRIVDGGDWAVHRMTGAWCRNACAAGYKGLWNAELGFPGKDFLGALDPAIRDVSDKWLQNIVLPGVCAGTISADFAKSTGLVAGTPVSAATIDAHSGVPGMGVSDEGTASIIMGTSSCHMLLSRTLHFFEGFAAVAKDGIIPGFYGYESGQSAVGDIFAWFAKTFLAAQGSDPYAALTAKAAALAPGEAGVMALDWMNGNRSVLMNANLSGALLGLTLNTRPEEVYRALVEATAFGTRIILDAYRHNGIPVNEVAVCGGLVRSPLIMQVYADVLELPVRVAASEHAVALGAAIFGAVAAGPDRRGFATVADAIPGMTRPPARSFLPRPEVARTYDELFDIYRQCHDHFGRGNADLMKQLKSMKHKTRGG